MAKVRERYDERERRKRIFKSIPFKRPPAQSLVWRQLCQAVDTGDREAH